MVDVIHSPLGAVGALMVLLESVMTAALFALQEQPRLQEILVWLMVGTIGSVTLTVIVIVILIAIKNPGLLFSPRELHPSIHMAVYGRGESVVPSGNIPADAIYIETIRE
jgi:hypothetical protein